MSIAKLVGAPAPVTIGGKEYTASPLTLYDFGTLEEAAKAALIRAAVEGTDGRPEADRETAIRVAGERGDGISIGSNAMLDYIRTLSGTMQLVSLSLSKRHPEMTRRKIGDVLIDQSAQLGDVKETVMRISGMLNEDSVGGNAAAGDKFPQPQATPAADGP